MTRQKNKKSSPAYELLSLVWEHAPSETGRSNQSMRKAMDLAITAGFPFVLDDFARAMENFRGSRWFDAEGFYSRAVTAGNLSAAQSYEAWWGRGPFIADDVHSSGGTTQKRGRLAVGSVFPWQGASVTVTSFSSDGKYLTACAYHERKNDDDYSKKVANRFTITRDGIREERAAGRSRTRLFERLGKLTAGSSRSQQAFRTATLRRLKRLGIACEEDWHKMPVAMLREVTAKIEKESKL